MSIPNTPTSQRSNTTQVPSAPRQTRRLIRRNAIDLGNVRRALFRTQFVLDAPYFNRYGGRRNAVDASVVRNLDESFNNDSVPDADDINPSTGNPYSWAPLQNRIHPRLSLEQNNELIRFNLDE